MFLVRSLPFFGCELLHLLDEKSLLSNLRVIFYDSIIPSEFSPLTCICKGHLAIHTVHVSGKLQMVLNKIFPLKRGKEQDAGTEMAHVRYDLFNSEQLSSGSLTHLMGSTASDYDYKRPQLCIQRELPYCLVKTKCFPLCTGAGQFLDQEHMILSRKGFQPTQ